MAMGLLRFEAVITLIVLAAAFSPWVARAQLSNSFYAQSCPGLEGVVNAGFQAALFSDGGIGASLLRMHFHDCLVQGCDASILLADTPTFTGEQSATPNINSIRGYNVVANIKAAVETACPATVSCADILALIARDAVISAGGPFWSVEYGRRDSTNACFGCVNTQIPSPFANVAQLTATFAAAGLDQTDMVTLAGAHTFGRAHCPLISGRFANFKGTNSSDPTLNPSYLATLLGECPAGASNQVNLDLTTPFTFDNAYYSNLLNNDGLLTSDQTIQSEGGSTASIVGNYAGNQFNFFTMFVPAIIKMGEISPLTGSAGEIRKVCSAVN